MNSSSSSRNATDASPSLFALEMAIVTRQPAPGVIHHSDQGVQFACNAYTDFLKQHGFQISMSRKANPFDNKQVESFMATLKKEEVYLSDYRTFEKASRRLPRFIDDVYNWKHLHSSIGYLSPVAFEIKQNQTQQPAATHLSLHI